MPTKHLAANVRDLPGAAVLDLSGKIDDFSQNLLNAAYSEAEAMTTT